MSAAGTFSVAELGHYALVLALALMLVQSSVPLLGLRWRDARLVAVSGTTPIVGFGFIAVAFVALTAAHVTSDFSVRNVYENSNSAQPLLFKITGVWGNHEGSMLLWVLILSLFGALVAGFGSNLPSALRARVLAVQGWIGSAFLLFILLTSNPFARLDPAPLQGQDLNPILQDIGLAIHPPLLYLGYVGFSIAFSFAVAALLEGRTDAAWARWVRPWTLAAWMFLTAGIAMGSYWAYYELGWGGWWFWDPVENASFMPWLAGTALLHSAVVMEKRGALKVWTVLLAILTFSLSLLGTFLVRSGVLTSVHSFASDPTRGVFILAILTLFIGGALALFALRAPDMKQGGLFAPISREGALVFNNLFLVAAAATVFVGTLYPLALEALTGDKISVGAPYFHLTFVPVMIPLLLALPFGPMLGWKRGDLYGAAQRLAVAMGAALFAAIVTAVLTGGKGALAPLWPGARHLDRCRKPRRSRRADDALQVRRANKPGAARRPAALGSRHGRRALRHGALRDRHRVGDRLPGGEDRRDEAGRDDRGRRLHAALQGKRAGDRTELPRGARALRRLARRERRL